MILPPPFSRALGLAICLLALPAGLVAQGPLQHWKSLASPLPKTQAFAASAVDQGKLWLVGGERQGTALSSVQILNPQSSTWSAGPALPKGRTRAGASVVGSRLFIVGGRVSGLPVAGMLELVQGKWKSAPSMAVARSSHALIADKTALYVLGGRSGKALVSQKSCERFNATKGIWSSLPAMPGPRFGHSVHLAGGKLYVFGGFSDSETKPLRSTWVLDLARLTWTVESAMADQIDFHGYGTSYVDFTGQRILLGGQGSASPEISGTSCERLDLASGAPRWFACTPAWLPVLGAAAATIAGRTFLAGGAYLDGGQIRGSTRVQELQKIVLVRKIIAKGQGFPFPVEVVHPPLIKGRKLPVLVFEPGLAEVPSSYTQLQNQLAALGFFVMSHDTSFLLSPSTFSRVQVRAATEVSKSSVYGPFLDDRYVFGGFSAGGGGALISAGSMSKTAAVFALAPWAGCIPSSARCGTKSPVINKASSVRTPVFLMANQGDVLGTKANTDWILENLVNAARFRVSYVLQAKDHGGKSTGQGFANTHAKTLPAGRELQQLVFRYVLSFLEATVLDSPRDPGPVVLGRSGEVYARWLGQGARQDPNIQRAQRFVQKPELYLRMPGGKHGGARLQVGILGRPSTSSLFLISGGPVSKIALGSLGNFLLDLPSLIAVPLLLPSSGQLEVSVPIPSGLKGVIHFQSLGFDGAKLASFVFSGWRRSLKF